MLVKMQSKRLDVESFYFTIYELEKGIFAAIAKIEAGISSNAGFFDLGNHLIVFDTTIHPEAARELLGIIRQVTSKEPTLIINSHAHIDHIFGNYVFAESIPIISSREMLAQFNDYALPRLQELIERAPEDIKNTEKELNEASTPEKRKEFESDLKFYREIQTDKFKLRPPDFIFKKKLTIHGNGTVVEIINLGEAHSQGEVIAHFSNEKIAFMGDAFFANIDPSWATREAQMPFAVNPQKLHDILMEFMEKDIEIFVSGHGELSAKDGIKKNIEFIQEFLLK